MIDYEPDRFKWEQIADMLRSRIADGTYPSKHLLSEVQLMQEFEVARGTLRKAMQRLRDEGLIYTVPNLGSFVSPQDDPTN
ncbi:winged helix-turn-helix domain-containing protein [Nonomuraea soli]|uniref:GntR family transcriptional regulator n=1 Tax=Nonomuraea soli TaxID=1032476 RepID=A0A7W0CQJ7_9ACTN|nr:winged helix-turn-helix domain-containing protein [Nonomuraea soli]MBA2895455.1 GntR family transcriptional regulator [Nonomuraea soli]